MLAHLTTERIEEIVTSWRKDPIDQFRIQHQIDQYILGRDQPQIYTYAFSRLIEEYVQWILEGWGYRVNQTVHTAPFDLWVEDCVRIEVKAANWTKRAAIPNHGRYKATIRNSGADYLIFDCINGTHHFFVIPRRAIGERRSLEVTQYNVERYRGQWAPFLSSWQQLKDYVEVSRPEPTQLTMPKEVATNAQLL